MFPKQFQELIKYLSKLNGVGEKTAQRYAFEMLKWEVEDQITFSEVLKKLHVTIKKCQNCANFCEDKICDICADTTRNDKIICVVSNIKDLIAIEKTQQFDGKYYVLNGLISIQNGVYPEDLMIDEFVDRCEKNQVKEVILALNLNIDGETTSLYLAKRLHTKGIASSRIATGLPIGGNIEYADEMTLTNALIGRKKLEE